MSTGIPARAAGWLLGMLVTSRSLREAMLGDLCEVLSRGGPHLFWRELATSLPALFWARLRRGDPLGTVALALLTVSPLLACEWLAAYSLSLVPLKASASRPWWFVLAATWFPALLAWYAGSGRDGAKPALWPLALGSASLLAVMAMPWTWVYRAAAVLFISLAGALSRPESRWRLIR